MEDEAHYEQTEDAAGDSDTEETTALEESAAKINDSNVLLSSLIITIEGIP